MVLRTGQKIIIQALPKIKFGKIIMENQFLLVQPLMVVVFTSISRRFQVKFTHILSTLRLNTAFGLRV